MLTAAIVGTGLVAAGAAGTAAAGVAGAYIYKRKQNQKKKKKRKAQKESCVFGQHLEEVTLLSNNDLPEIFDYTITWLECNSK